MLKKRTSRMKQLLAHNHVGQISRAEATEILGALNSLNQLNRMSRISQSLPYKPGMLAKMRKSWAYLIWGEDEVEVRINRCLTDERYRVRYIYKSSVQELIGWGRPNQYPLRNARVDYGLRYLGFSF